MCLKSGTKLYINRSHTALKSGTAAAGSAEYDSAPKRIFSRSIAFRATKPAAKSQTRDMLRDKTVKEWNLWQKKR